MQLLKFMFICFAVLVPGKADTGLERELEELEKNLLALEEGYDKKAGYPTAQSMLGASEASTGLERELEELETGFLELEKGYDKKASNGPAQLDYIGYHYFGCYQDKRERILQGKETRSADMTIQKCMQICSDEGDYYAGVENANVCFCGKRLMQYKKLKDSECSKACAGNSGQKCGGSWKISVYTTRDYIGYHYFGCYQDKRERILQGKVTRSADMTIQKCMQICSDEGDYYAGVENANVCFCGKRLMQYKKLKNSECSKACAGNSGQKCGGSWKISVYTTRVNFGYVGCYKDKQARILEGKETSGDMTLQKCIQICTFEGDYYAGVEFGHVCFCGKYLKPYEKVGDSERSMDCTGNPDQKCGDSWRISVYTTYVNYLGCYKDNSARILEGLVHKYHKMTTEYCINFCKKLGKRFALIEYSNACICGNHLTPSKKLKDSDCDSKCEGATSECCGGAWKGSLYFLQ